MSQPIVDQVYDDVTNAGLFYKNPKKARARWVGYGFVRRRGAGAS